jgi:hypothetical protein
MKILKPKYVKKANKWCVTWFDKKQHIDWFSTKEEALKFYNQKFESL